MDEIFEFIFKNRRTILTILILATGLMLLIIMQIQKIFFKPGDFLIHEGKYKEALDKLFLAVSKNVNNWRLYLRIGFCYYMLGIQNHALEYFKKTIDINKTNIFAHYYLSFLLLDTGDFIGANIHIEEVEKQIERGKSRRINKFCLTELQGWYHYRRGMVGKALSSYTQINEVIENEFENKNFKKLKLFTPLFSNFGQIYIKRNIPLIYRTGKFFLSQGNLKRTREIFLFIIGVADKETFFFKRVSEEIKELNRDFSTSLSK